MAQCRYFSRLKIREKAHRQFREGDSLLRLGYKVVCECQFLGDYKERRRMELTKIFGVDYREPGNWGVDVV